MVRQQKHNFSVYAIYDKHTACVMRIEDVMYIYFTGNMLLHYQYRLWSRQVPWCIAELMRTGK